jgi:predicted peptidase
MKHFISICTYFLFILLFPGNQILIAQQVPHQISIETKVDMKYLLYLPKAYDTDTSAYFPLLLFLHGSGESGDNIEKVKTHGPPKLIANGMEFPFIVLSPQNPDINKLWDENAVISLLDNIQKNYRVDPKRIHIAGLSRGAYGVWQVAIQNPARFASLTAICGVAPGYYVKWLKDMPIWVFHGEDDNVIPISESDNVVRELKANGQNVRFTRYPNTGHDAWTKTFDNPELFKWMLEQSLE